MSPLEIETLHRQWLEQPITRELRKVIDNHKVRIIDAICVASKDTTEEQQRKLSQLAVQLNTTNTIEKLIYDTNIFAQNSARASSNS